MHSPFAHLIECFFEHVIATSCIDGHDMGENINSLTVPFLSGQWLLFASFRTLNK